MADIVLCPLLEMIIEKLASPLFEKLKDLYSLKENIMKLRRSLPMVQAILEDAEKQRTTEKAVEVWLLKLKDTVYETEDLLDELGVEMMRCEGRKSITDQARRFLLPFEPSRRFFDLASDLQKNLAEFDKIVMEGFRLNLRESSVQKQCRRRPTGSFVGKSEIYGREEDKKKLLKLLLPSSKSKTAEDVSVIPIVGIGGLGKTTFARLVYNDDIVTQYFDLKIWIYVSEDFDVTKLMIAIIESATKKRCKLLEMDLLQYQLQESLCGTRFLLVLDDVWNEDQEEWEELGNILRCGVEGSKIILTTRSNKVASIMGTTSAYHLQGLLEEDCWVLFKKVAFGQGEEDSHTNLLPIGRKIIKKCAGVPLAAKTLGSLLRFKREEKDWLLVQESELWDLNEYQIGILPALKLSYFHLPLHLKRCFVFCSLFPKNHEIKKEKLIHIWMAEGLILPSGGNKQLEDIGDEYFNDLLCLHFFQDVEKNDIEGTTVYKMHDLIHDLAQSIGGYEFAILGHGSGPSALAQTHHSSMICDFDTSSFPQELFKARRLRTLLFLFPGGYSEELVSLLPARFVYLRVLDLSGCGIKRLPSTIGELICLRCLDLSNTSIQALPHTLRNLCNLQTLNLTGCHNLVEFPFGMASLTSLRHLNTLGCENLIDTPAGLGKLVHLQTLPIYIVGTGAGESISELECLNLRGELNIKRLEKVRDANEAKKAKLIEKKHLKLLKLQWGVVEERCKLRSTRGSALHDAKQRKNVGSSQGNEVEDILQWLEPHPNITEIVIKGYPGIRFPRWILPNLVALELVNCRKCEKLPTLGQLPLLKALCLQGMDAVVRIDQEFYSMESQKPFPSLKELTLRYFPNLEEWSCVNDSKAFPCLEKLVIDECPNLKTAPVFQSLQQLELRSCHPMIINSLENITSLSSLVIDTFPELLHLSGELLENSKCLASLEIHSCQNLQSLPSELDNVVSLKSLIISHCQGLSYLPLGLQKLKLLEFLEINGCHSMIKLPEEGIRGLRSLKSFSIENCGNLISLSSGLCQLTALEQLSIMSCPKLAFLPDGLQNLSALRSLNIVSCPELISLPDSLQHVTTLQSLVIHSCSGLTALPDWFGNFSSLRSLTIYNCHYLTLLPEGLQQLTTIQHLSIQGCPLLERRCKQGRGKEWQKIAHIPHIYIGSPEFVKSSGSSTE